jgi:subtilisin family serine protease
MRMINISAFAGLQMAGLIVGSALAASRPAASEYVEGEALVIFRAPSTLAAAEQTLGARSLSMTRHFAWLSERMRQQVGLVRSAGKTTAELVAELSQDPSVELAEPNYRRWVRGTALPDDPMFPRLWAMRNTGQTVNGAAGAANADIHFPEAWSLARPPDGHVVVAVIDTGVDYAHPDLVNNVWTNPGEIQGNGLDDEGDGYADDSFGYDFADGDADPMDAGDHGTHVAGTIAAAGNNGLGVIGVEYRAKVAVLKVSSDGDTISTSAELEAIQYAAMMKARGVNVVAINASFGGGTYSATERAAIQSAGDADIVFCAAAGNDGADNDATPIYPASYRLANMIVVAASDQQDALAGFSNYGATTVDLAAPA